MLARGETLTAAELGLLMARNPERAIELVVLAACRTGEAFNGHDEAYSLGTGFLAAGVHSVLCTLWNIPDGLTSVMMYAFHHYLRVESMPVWAALRAAQLWMLDPGRPELAGMPAQLARRCRSPLLTDLRAWAAFIHWGR
jgi:CHAT domain-containing protein